jgi:hypothetical protein
MTATAPMTPSSAKYGAKTTTLCLETVLVTSQILQFWKRRGTVPVTAHFLTFQACVGETVLESLGFVACGCERVTFPLRGNGESTICEVHMGKRGPVSWLKKPPFPL